MSGISSFNFDYQSCDGAVCRVWHRRFQADACQIIQTHTSFTRHDLDANHLNSPPADTHTSDARSRGFSR